MTRKSFVPRNLDGLMTHLLGRARGAARSQVERSERRVLQRLRQEPLWTSDAPLFADDADPVRRWPSAASVAVAATVLIGLVSAGLVVRDSILGPSIAAVVEAGEGAFTIASNGHTRSAEMDGRIAFGDIVRSNSGSGGMLRLGDGSRVEMRSRSEVSLEHAADGVRIRLSYGGLIVNAAKQRDGHLSVQTKDFVVSVVGTVFLVNAEESGSRVAVLEGEVRVQQGDVDRRLQPGQQVMTSPLSTGPLQPEELAWSRNAPSHLALLARSSAPVAEQSELVSRSMAAPSVQAEPGAAAQDSAAGGSQPSRFPLVDVVPVDAIVRDAAGEPVLDLDVSDFAVFDDGVQQPIERSMLVRNGATPYYLLSYRTPANAQPGRFRRLQVRVERPGVRVDARPGYYTRGELWSGAYGEDEPGLMPPVLRERQEPTYPIEAVAARIQGAVVVEAVVDVDGRVSRSRVVSSPDNGRARGDSGQGLGDHALKAVTQWTFTPGELRGQKVPVLMRLVVTFRLH